MKEKKKEKKLKWRVEDLQQIRLDNAMVLTSQVMQLLQKIQGWTVEETNTVYKATVNTVEKDWGSFPADMKYQLISNNVLSWMLSGEVVNIIPGSKPVSSNMVI